jgi:hypothetical protein
MNSVEKKPKRREDIAIQELGDEAMIYDSVNEKVHVLNYTAFCIWQLCDGNNTIDDIKIKMNNQFASSDKNDILSDVAETIKDFEKNKLIL